jgi:hypothetical protein
MGTMGTMGTMEFFLGPFLTWLPTVFYSAVFLLAVLIYFNKLPVTRYRLPVTGYPLMVAITISFRVFYAVFLSVSQYYIWLQDEFTKLFLPPHYSISYFFTYVWGRFWINPLIVISISALFWLFLKALKKHNERFFSEGDVELGFLSALLVGWPGFAVFLPLIFIIALVVSIICLFFFKEKFTALGLPFLIAVLVVFVWGSRFIDILNITVLGI